MSGRMYTAGMARSTMREQHAKPRRRRSVKEDACKWYALMGYNVDDQDDTGLLALDRSLSAHSSYKITHDIADALKFPAKNINKISSFGDPDQWLDFFSKDPELSSWRFHLIGVRKPC